MQPDKWGVGRVDIAVSEDDHPRAAKCIHRDLDLEAITHSPAGRRSLTDVALDCHPTSNHAISSHGSH
jgi:hypothetical protein